MCSFIISMNIAYATQRYEHGTVKWVFTINSFGDCEAIRFYGYGKASCIKQFECLDDMITCIDWYKSHGWSVRIPHKAKAMIA